MCEATTPGVGNVLSEASLEFVPEAHCFLRVDCEIVDMTGLALGDQALDFVTEHEINADQINGYKEQYHKSYVRDWCGDEQFDQVWAVREACIAALSTHHSKADSVL